ncbi:MAG: hypothetical protein NVV74_23120 [Magnetospirillum sp.]|nr:hypothetical protein [Magnetospirillum sp.]
MSARAVAQFLFRHQRLMLMTLALSLAVGGSVVHWRPVLWRAEASLLVEAGRADGARALAAMLESRDLHAQVLARWGDRLYPTLPRESRADAFARDLAVIPAEGAGLVRLWLDGSDGDGAARALADLLDRLAEKNRTVFAVTPDAEATRQLAEAREALAAFRKRAGIAEGGTDKAALLKRRGELDSDITVAEAEAGALGERLGVLKTRLAATPPTIEISSESERSKVAEEARGKLFEPAGQGSRVAGQVPGRQRLRAEPAQREAQGRGSAGQAGYRHPEPGGQRYQPGAPGTGKGKRAHRGGAVGGQGAGQVGAASTGRTGSPA